MKTKLITTITTIMIMLFLASVLSVAFDKIPTVKATGEVLFDENFESYAVGSFPSNFYAVWGGWSVVEENGNKFLSSDTDPGADYLLYTTQKFPGDVTIEWSERHTFASDPFIHISLSNGLITETAFPGQWSVTLLATGTSYGFSYSWTNDGVNWVTGNNFPLGTCTTQPSDWSKVKLILSGSLAYFYVDDSFIFSCDLSTVIPFPIENFFLSWMTWGQRDLDNVKVYRTQYQVTFSQTGLDSDAGSNTVLTLGGVNYAYNNLPSGLWVDSGTTFSWSSPVSGGTDKQFVMTSDDGGLTSPIGASGTDTATYKTQFRVTFTASDNVRMTAPGGTTIVTVGGSAKAGGDLPFKTDWIDFGGTVDWAFSNPVAGGNGWTRYSWTSTSGLGQSGQSGTLTVSAAGTVTGTYTTQYKVTASYSTSDSSTPSANVVLSGTSLGSASQTTLATSTTQVWLDAGSGWSVNNPITAVSGTERWDATSGTSGTVTGAITVVPSYYHQYQVTFKYTKENPTDWGSPTAPTAYYTQFGGDASMLAALDTDPPVSDWVDAGTAVWYDNPLGGSVSLTEQWATNLQIYVCGSEVADSVGSSTSPIDPMYYHQYFITFQFSIANSPAGSPIYGPSVTFNQFGDPKWWDSAGLDTSSHDWVDASSSPTAITYAIGVVAASGTERWQASSAPTFDAASSRTLDPSTYYHQYKVTFSQTGLGSDAGSNTVLTLGGVHYAYNALPSNVWVDSGTTFNWSPTVAGVSGKQFYYTGDSGLASPIVTSGTDAATYKTQYQVTFTQTGSLAAPKVTYQIGSGPATTGTVPFQVWVDRGLQISFTYDSVVAGAPGVQYILVSTSPSSPQTVTRALTVKGSYKTQYQVNFAQTGVDSSFSGTVVTVDGQKIGGGGASFWWDSQSIHSFAFQSPLTIDSGKRNAWTSTTGLSTLQSTTKFKVTGTGTITGNYKTQWHITFSQTGVGTDYTGTAVTVNGVNSRRTGYTYWADDGSTCTFAFKSPLSVCSGKQYVWTSTTDLSTLQSGSFKVTTSGTITGAYKTQYKITFKTSGISSDYTGNVMTVNGINYDKNGVTLWADQASTIPFAFQSPLIVSPHKQYIWTSTTGLTSLQIGTLTVTNSGTITANYKTKNT